jgi:hypothetical protein
MVKLTSSPLGEGEWSASCGSDHRLSHRCEEIPVPMSTTIPAGKVALMLPYRGIFCEKNYVLQRN